MSQDKQPAGQMFEYILTHHRGLFATLVLLPISCLYSSYVYLRNHILFRLRSAPSRHEQRVRDVIRQIEDWQQAGAREQLCTARSGWQAMSEMVPISPIVNVPRIVPATTGLNATSSAPATMPAMPPHSAAARPMRRTTRSPASPEMMAPMAKAEKWRLATA